MEAFCKAGASSIAAFCKVGDAEKAENSVRAAPRDEIKRFWEVGDEEEAASTQGIKEAGDAESYGKQLCCEGCVAEEKPSCDVHITENTCLCAFGDGLHHHEADSVETDDWVSPRISFSRDFVMADIYSLSQNTYSRVSPERKNGEHDIKDNYSAEFAFLKDGPAHDARDQAKGFMLSADELFFDGKLLPLPFPSIWAASDDLSLSSSCIKHRQEPAQNSHNRPLSRHLSFEIPKPSSSTTTSSSFSLRSTCPCISSPCKSLHLDTSSAYSDARIPVSLSLPSSPSTSSSLLQSPPLPSSSSISLPPTSPAPSPSLPSLSLLSPSILSTTSTSSMPSPSVIKCSAKLKDLFKSKKNSKDSSPSPLARDNSVTSTCRLPISSRSFWPFSRSNSAGVSKSTAPPSLPCRSNSAGESHTCDAPSPPKHLDAIDVAELSTSSLVGCPKEQGTKPAEHGESFDTSESTVPLEVASAEENLNVCNQSSHGADTCLDNSESRTMSENVKSLGVQGLSKVSGKKVIETPGKGSPGKRKGVSGSSGGKVNGGKIVLRNLERCSAEKKLGKDRWRGLNRRGSFPVGARVSPVLNVAVYRGPSTPKIGLFRFNTSLFSKKEKPVEAAVNWRNAA